MSKVTDVDEPKLSVGSIQLAHFSVKGDERDRVASEQEQTGDTTDLSIEAAFAGGQEGRPPSTHNTPNSVISGTGGQKGWPEWGEGGGTGLLVRSMRTC